MIRPIDPSHVQPPVHFNEGSGSTNSRITAVVLTVLASLASILFLPLEAALGLSVVIAVIAGSVCFRSSSSSVIISSRRSWYDSWFDAIPFFRRRTVVQVATPSYAPGGTVYRQPDGPHARVTGGHSSTPYHGASAQIPLARPAASARPAAFGPPGGPSGPCGGGGGGGGGGGRHAIPRQRHRR